MEHVSVELEGEPFLSAAQLNDLRRRAVEALEQALTEAHRPYEPVRGEAPVRKKPTAPKKRYVAAQVVTADQCAAALDGGADRIYMRAEDTFGRETDAMLDMETDAEKYLVLPPFWRAPQMRREFQRRIGGLMARGCRVLSRVRWASLLFAEEWGSCGGRSVGECGKHSFGVLF